MMVYISLRISAFDSKLKKLFVKCAFGFKKQLANWVVKISPIICQNTNYIENFSLFP